MISIKMGDSLRGTIRRLEWLKDNQSKINQGLVGESADELIKIFHDGIKNDTFLLPELADETIAGKRRKGYERPENPLYGKGDKRQSNRDTYSSMMRKRRIKNGIKVEPSKAKHWSMNITLDKLFQIHEYGATIQTKSGNLIIIPKRPAFRYAILFFKRSKKNPTIRLKKLLDGFVKNGKYKRELESLIRYGKTEDKP